MKKELLTLVIGILIGAIIATGIFLVLQNNSSDNGKMGGRDSQGQMGEPPDGNMIPEGRGMNNEDMQTNTTES